MVRISCKFAVIAVLVLLGLVDRMHADTRVWTGATSHNWNIFSNWSTSVPGTNDVAFFDGDGNGNTSIVGGFGTIQAVEFLGPNVAAYTLGASPGINNITFSETGTFNSIFINAVTANHQVVNSDLVLGTANGAWEHNIRNNSTQGALLTLAGGISPGGTGKAISVIGAGNVAITGDIVGGFETLALNKSGSGTLTLDGAFSGSGPTNIAAGIVLFNGTHSGGGGATVVGGTLGGTGAVTGPTIIQAGANLAPGTSTVTASLELNAMTLQQDATLAIKLGGTTFDFNVNEQYDRMRMAGVTNLQGGLNVSLINDHALADGNLYGILQANADRNGTFANYAEDDIVLTQGLFNLKITYVGNITDSSLSLTGGNDIVLFAEPVPEPGTAALLGLGALMLLHWRRSCS